jgi:hypothetical protein
VNAFRPSPILVAVAVVTAWYLVGNARRAFGVGDVSAAVSAGHLTSRDARMVRLEKLRVLLLAGGLALLLPFYLSNLFGAPYWASIALLGGALIVLASAIVVSVVIEVLGGFPRGRFSGGRGRGV